MFRKYPQPKTAIFLVLFLSLPFQVFCQVSNVIIMANVKGTVTATNDATGESITAANGVQITDQYTIVTGADGSVALLFSSGSTVTVRENSRLQVAQFTQEPHEETGRLRGLTREPSVSTTRLKLDYGSIVGSTKSLRPRSNFEIVTPIGIGGIRGTDWIVQLQQITVDTVNAIIGVAQGEFEFTPTGGNTSQITGGKQLVLSVTVDAQGAITEIGVARMENLDPAIAAEINSIVAEANLEIDAALGNLQESGGGGDAGGGEGTTTSSGLKIYEISLFGDIPASSAILNYPILTTLFQSPSSTASGPTASPGDPAAPTDIPIQSTPQIPPASL